MAVAYLLLVLVGALGVLSLLVWLFGEKPSGARTRRETTRSVGKKERVGEGGTTPSTEIEHWEERAA
jgi:hypothetical protein